jgi:hypothetical protein
MFKRRLFVVLVVLAILVVVNPTVKGGYLDKQLKAVCEDIFSNGLEFNPYILSTNGIEATAEEEDEVRKFLRNPRVWNALTSFGREKLMESDLWQGYVNVEFVKDADSVYSIYDCIKHMRGVFPPPKKLF